MSTQMDHRLKRALRGELRYFAVIALAYLIGLQSIAAPFMQARANEAARIEAALGVLCSTDDPAHPGQSDGHKHEHDLPCCLPAFRILLGDYVAITSDVIAPHAPVFVATGADFAFPQPRAPPSIARTPAQPRAPPAIPI